MASTEKNLHDIFTDLNETIRGALKQKIKTKWQTLTERNKMKGGLKRLMDKKEAMYAEVKDLENKIRELGRKIEESDKQVYEEDMKPGVKNFLEDVYGSAYNAKLSAVTAAEALLESKEYKNFKAYNAVWVNARNMYGLAVNSKEKRQVIMRLQNQNWRSLGIAVPEMPFLEEFTIEGGVITVPEDRRLETPKPVNVTTA